MANVTAGDNTTYEDHSSFIFDRGTRTYTNAYATIQHTSRRAIVDLNIKNNLLLSMDENGIDTYQIDEPMIFIYPTNKEDENNKF